MAFKKELNKFIENDDMDNRIKQYLVCMDRDEES